MRVNEIFYSIQGEGRFTGTPSVFIRLSGCNLRCEFCDTEHQPYKDLTEDEIMQEIAKYPAKHIVITGGEPLLQLKGSFIEKLHRADKFVQIETNGTRPLDEFHLTRIDWITCSPKFEFCPNADIKLNHIDELKVVVKKGQDMSKYDNIIAQEYYVQPCDVKDEKENAEILAQAINFIKSHPKWKLSLQTQKILNVR